jgi:hypothetical protein
MGTNWGRRLAAAATLLAAGACSSHNTPAASTTQSQPAVPAASATGAADLQPILDQVGQMDVAMKRLDDEISGVDSGINSTQEGDVGR